MWTSLSDAWAAYPVLQAIIINFIAAALILVVGWAVSGLLGRSIHRLASRSTHLDPTIIPMLEATAVWAIRVFVIIAVLARFGVQTASLIAALSAAGLAIGLALQGTLQNIAAGIMLLVLRPLRVGEYVSIVGRSEGTVEEVGLFMSRLRQADGIIVHMPNSLVWGNTIINYSRNLQRRMELVVQVPRSDDLEAVLVALQELVVAHQHVLDAPAPQVMVSASMETYTSVTIQAWAEVQHYSATRIDLYRNALATIRQVRERKAAN
jgi:Small-conductance mechanosensitive channel